MGGSLNTYYLLWKNFPDITQKQTLALSWAGESQCKFPWASNFA